MEESTLQLALLALRTRRDVLRALQKVRLLVGLAGVDRKHGAAFVRQLRDAIRTAVEHGRQVRVDLLLATRSRKQTIEAEVRALGADSTGDAPVRLAAPLPADAAVSLLEAGHWVELLAAKTPQQAVLIGQNTTRRLAAEVQRLTAWSGELQQELLQSRILNETLELLALVASKTENAVAVLDGEGRVEWINDGFVKLTGYSLADVRQRTLAELIPSEAVDGGGDIGAAIAAGRGGNFHIRQVRPDGARYWASLSITPVLDDSGRLSRWIAIGDDVTHHHETQLVLERAKEAAEAANRAKSQFLAHISHEIRTPMNAILGMTELALSTTLTAEQRDYLATVKAAAESMLRLLNDLLDLSKIEAGKLEIEAVEFDLAEIREEIFKPFVVRAAERGLRIEWKPSPKTPQRLIGDPTRLKQILTNLVGNAVKFTPQGKVAVQISVHKRRKKSVELHFVVSDTGIGIPAAKLTQIFEAFAQADRSTTRRYGGTGLGLTISSHLVELLGGRIWVESQEGRGSAFHFSLPFDLPETAALAETAVLPAAAEASDGSAAVLAIEPDAPALRPLRVLVADDNEANRRLAARILQKRGHEVVEVSSGRSAVEAVQRARFDIVLMDVQMPDMDGLEATEAIRQWERRTGSSRLPIIAMTAYAMRGDRDRCLAAGMDAYLAKPLRPVDVRELVESTAALHAGGVAAPSRKPPDAPASAEGFAAALARVEGDMPILCEQMEFYLKDSPALAEQIWTAIAARDFVTLGAAAHRLKGLVATFDDAAADTAQRLQQMGDACDLEDAPAVAQQFASQLAALRAKIERFLAAVRAG